MKQKRVAELESEWREQIEERLDRLEEMCRKGFETNLEELLGIWCALEKEEEVRDGEDVEMEVV